ncbi:MAG TPA: transglutaminase domain-containing protein [Bacteroidales bacterium]
MKKKNLASPFLKTLVTYLTLLFFFHPLQAQDLWKGNYKAADKIASKVDKTTDLKTLSDNLTQNLTDTSDKYRAIFTWVATNISYDIDAMDKPNPGETNPEEVIITGKSVCEGYANLFQALCEQSGLVCKTISGWTKNFPSKIKEALPRNTTHAWNAVKIKGKWYLCDVTWASGYLSEETNKFVREFNGAYFCMPPKLFCLNHYPEDTKWFLTDSISKQYFINLPHFYTFALANNIQNVRPEHGIIEYEQGKKVNFSFALDLSVQHILVRPSETHRLQSVYFDQQRQMISFDYRLEQYSAFLYIYINNQGAIVYRLKK